MERTDNKQANKDFRGISAVKKAEQRIMIEYDGNEAVVDGVSIGGLSIRVEHWNWVLNNKKTTMGRTGERAFQPAETVNEKALNGNRFGMLNWNKDNWARGMWSDLYFKSSLLLGPQELRLFEVSDHWKITHSDGFSVFLVPPEWNILNRKPSGHQHTIRNKD